MQNLKENTYFHFLIKLLYSWIVIDFFKSGFPNGVYVESWRVPIESRNARRNRMLSDKIKKEILRAYYYDKNFFEDLSKPK